MSVLLGGKKTKKKPQGVWCLKGSWGGKANDRCVTCGMDSNHQNIVDLRRAYVLGSAEFVSAEIHVFNRQYHLTPRIHSRRGCKRIKVV